MGLLKNFIGNFKKHDALDLAKGFKLEEITDSTPVFINNTGYRLQNKTVRNAIKNVVENIFECLEEKVLVRKRRSIEE